MSTALVQPKIEITQEQIALIKKTVAKEATDDELKLYFYDCQRRGVHPLDKLIHFTKRAGKYTPVTSIDFMRIRASESGEYAGNDDAIFAWHSDDPKYPVSAAVTVWRIVNGTRCPFSATARWSEYVPQDAFMWKKMPCTMLGKCAEALALRKAFPGQLQGLYAREEMDQSGNEPKMEPAEARAYAAKVLQKDATTVDRDNHIFPDPPEKPLTKALRQSVALEAPKDYQEDDDGNASFTLTRVQSATTKKGAPYRKLYWNGGSAQCFQADQFEEIDSLRPGQRVGVSGVCHNGGFTDFAKVLGAINPEDMVESIAEARPMPKADASDYEIPF